MEVGINGLWLAENALNPLALLLMRWMNSTLPIRENFNLTLFLPENSKLDGTKDVHTVIVGSSKSPSARLHYDQWALPRAAADRGIDLLLYVGQRAPLSSTVPVMSFSDVQLQDSAAGIVERARNTLGMVGAAGAIAMLRPDDYPSLQSRMDGAHRLIPISSWVDPEFLEQEASKINRAQGSENWPEAYVLCHGLGSSELSFLLSAWTWVASALGDSYPLVILTGSKSLRNKIRGEAQLLGVEESVQPLGAIRARDLPMLYKGAHALINVSHRGWGQQLRWAMASGVPIAGVRDGVHESVLHDAGYLVDPGDSRKLGAACIGLLVEDKLAQLLREKGRKRSARFQTAQAQESLVQAIVTIIKEL